MWMTVVSQAILKNKLSERVKEINTIDMASLLLFGFCKLYSNLVYQLQIKTNINKF